MKNLLWFHAFNRDTAADVLGVLEKGPVPPRKNVGSNTAANEDALGIERSVYAYLGRSADLFGKNGYVLPIAQRPANGRVSPFDTGGLVSHIKPVARWPVADKRDYLHAYSWSCKSLAKLLKQYPNTSGLAAYVDGQVPAYPGPHVPWPGKCKKTGDIWADGVNQWQAWTWELRSGTGLPAGTKLKFWTAPPDLFGEVQRLAEAASGKQQDWFMFLSETYVPGGISRLLAELRAGQTTA